MKLRITRKRALAIAAATAAATALALTAASTSGASASVRSDYRSVTAHTFTTGHDDTTSVSGPGTRTSPNGPVWAEDTLWFTLTSHRTGPDTYDVVISARGFYNGFADPRTGNAEYLRGRVHGWLDETVTSPTGPNRFYVAQQEPGSMSQSAIVQQFFGGAATAIVGGHYSYDYGRVNGIDYTQVG
jgi:hypothetical protein